MVKPSSLKRLGAAHCQLGCRAAIGPDMLIFIGRSSTFHSFYAALKLCFNCFVDCLMVGCFMFLFLVYPNIMFHWSYVCQFQRLFYRHGFFTFMFLVGKENPLKQLGWPTAWRFYGVKYGCLLTLPPPSATDAMAQKGTPSASKAVTWAEIAPSDGENLAYLTTLNIVS